MVANGLIRAQGSRFALAPRSGGPWCARHGHWIGGESPLRSELVATASRRQLHAGIAVERRRFLAPRGHVGKKPEGRLQHRTRVKPCAGRADRVSVPRNATPEIQPRSERYWGRERRHVQCSYPGRSAGVRLKSGRREGGDDDRPRSLQKSDLFVVCAGQRVSHGG